MQIEKYMNGTKEPDVVLLNHEAIMNDDNDSYYWNYTCYLLVNLNPKKVEFTSYLPLDKSEILNKAKNELRPTNSSFQSYMGAQNGTTAQ